MKTDAIVLGFLVVYLVALAAMLFALLDHLDPD